MQSAIKNDLDKQNPAFSYYGRAGLGRRLGKQKGPVALMDAALALKILDTLCEEPDSPMDSSSGSESLLNDNVRFSEPHLPFEEKAEKTVNEDKEAAVRLVNEVEKTRVKALEEELEMLKLLSAYFVRRLPPVRITSLELLLSPRQKKLGSGISEITLSHVWTVRGEFSLVFCTRGSVHKTFQPTGYLSMYSSSVLGGVGTGIQPSASGLESRVL
ncbi:hypothetical protein TNCV_2356601 [Trichonephila clavipes]|nr:hypothetical protein TNCV_2356601 [Trichonephila clavipes]